MGLPLSGIRVVALEQAVAAPFCTRHLADLGADVVKVERPGGDFARGYDTAVKGESAYFVWLNRGKQSIVLDVKETADREVLHGLLGNADVFVHNLGPGAVDRLGLGWDVIRPRWPRMIDCAISGYGMSGPYRDRKAFDLLLQGESGIMAVTGTADEPMRVGISIADIGAGLYAFSAILAALYERQSTGLGRLIDISMLESLAEWMTAPLYFFKYGGAPPAHSGARHSAIVPYGLFRTWDGHVVNLAVQNSGQWDRFCAVVLERPELASDPRFSANESRVRNRAELEPIIESILGNATQATIEQRLEAADVPFGNVNGLAEVLAHPQLAARGRWFDVDSPGGTVQALVNPLNLVDMPLVAEPVPSLGQHSAALREEVARRLAGNGSGPSHSTASASAGASSPATATRRITSPPTDDR